MYNILSILIWGQYCDRDRIIYMYGSWKYNYLCNQCLSHLKLWVRIPLSSWWSVTETAFCYNVCQWLVAGRWFSPDTPVSSTNKTDRHDITEILLKVALNTIKQTANNEGCPWCYPFKCKVLFSSGMWKLTFALQPP